MEGQLFENGKGLKGLWKLEMGKRRDEKLLLARLAGSAWCTKRLLRGWFGP